MPMYDHWCPDCGYEVALLRPMSDYNASVTHPCPAHDGDTKPMPLKLPIVNIMNHALPDGTRRFAGIRAQRKREDEQRAKAREDRHRIVDLARQKGDY